MHTPVLRFGCLFSKCMLVFVMLILQACQNGERVPYINTGSAVGLPHMPFEAGQAVLLNQYVTPSIMTTSWVLADSTFVLNHSLAGFFETPGKGKLCILHWSQADDPVWIGARIPGQFLGADLLMYENNELVIRQYQANGEVTIGNELYRKEMEGLLKQMELLHYP